MGRKAIWKVESAGSKSRELRSTRLSIHICSPFIKIGVHQRPSSTTAASADCGETPSSTSFAGFGRGPSRQAIGGKLPGEAPIPAAGSVFAPFCLRLVLSPAGFSPSWFSPVFVSSFFLCFSLLFFFAFLSVVPSLPSLFSLFSFSSFPAFFFPCFLLFLLCISFSSSSSSSLSLPLLLFLYLFPVPLFAALLAGMTSAGRMAPVPVKHAVGL